MSKYFYCYSMNLKKFLMDNGLRYEVVAVNPNNNKLFYTFKRCKRLDMLLNDWKNGKK